MSVKKTGAAAVAPTGDRFFKVKLSRSYDYHGVNLSPRDDIVVSDIVLADMGDIVLESVEVDADGKEI